MEQSKRGRHHTSQVPVHFLPTVTVTTRSQRDIELSRASARSHLAKEIHRRRNERHGTGIGVVLSQGQGAATNGNIGYGTNSVLVLPRRGIKASSDESVRKGAREEVTATATEAHQSRNSKISTSQPQSNRQRRDPHTMFSASLELKRPEPWSTVFDGLSDHHTMRLLHHCRNSFWPGFGPGSATFHIPPFAFCFDALVNQGPTLFHALLWQSAVNMSFQMKTPIKDSSSIQHHQRAIRNIAQEIQKPIHDINEATIFSMLSLTVPESRQFDQREPFPAAFRPPLRTLGWMHVFGRQAVDDNHTGALYRVVDLRGGIDTLSMGGLSADMNYMDLIRSTQKLRRPHFRLAKILNGVRKDHFRHKYFGHAGDFVLDIPESMRRGEGAWGIDMLADHGLDAEFEEIMRNLRVWVRVLAKYENKTVSRPDLSIMASHRDLLQHRLLSTVSQHGLLGFRRVREVFDARDINQMADLNRLAQLALIIFSLGVSFPVTYQLPYKILVSELRAQITQDRDAVLEGGLQDFLIWLCMLGSICATTVFEEDSKDWFIGVLCQAERALTVAPGLSPPAGEVLAARTWVEVKRGSLVPFLWSGEACDAGGKIIWAEVQERMQVVGATEQ